MCIIASYNPIFIPIKKTSSLNQITLESRYNPLKSHKLPPLRIVLNPTNSTLKPPLNPGKILFKNLIQTHPNLSKPPEITII